MTVLRTVRAAEDRARSSRENEPLMVHQKNGHPEAGARFSPFAPRARRGSGSEGKSFGLPFTEDVFSDGIHRPFPSRGRGRFHRPTLCKNSFFLLFLSQGQVVIFRRICYNEVYGFRPFFEGGHRNIIFTILSKRGRNEDASFTEIHQGGRRRLHL